MARLFSSTTVALILLLTSPLVAGQDAIDHEGELAYDDGHSENSTSVARIGDGAAVRFTLEEPAYLISGGLFTDFAPFWNPVELAVLATDGPFGSPGTVLAVPWEFPLGAQGEYEYYALPEAVAVSGDFYLTYFQTREPFGDTNWIGLDTSAPLSGRLWKKSGETWSHTPDWDVMIPAMVADFPTAAKATTFERLKALYSPGRQGD